MTRRVLLPLAVTMALCAATSVLAHMPHTGSGGLQPAIEWPADAGRSTYRALEVTEAKLGKGVQDRVLTEESATFAVGEKVYLWMKLTGGPSDPIKVLWKVGDHTDTVSLTVGGNPWRTWSYKTAFKAGDWTVTVTDAAGATLKELTFTVK